MWGKVWRRVHEGQRRWLRAQRRPWKWLDRCGVTTRQWQLLSTSLENYELSEGWGPGETTLSDIPAVLARMKDMWNKMNSVFKLPEILRVATDISWMSSLGRSLGRQ
ncbi:unnamed protein product [Urochloa humidicola]